MTDIVNAFFKKFYPTEDMIANAEVNGGYGMIMRSVRDYSNIFPRMECNDGLKMSVQGHYGAYSFPRDDWADLYTQVEILALPDIDDLLTPYMSEHDKLDDEYIYPYVPVHVVVEVIKNHGGLKNEIS